MQQRVDLRLERLARERLAQKIAAGLTNRLLEVVPR